LVVSVITNGVPKYEYGIFSLSKKVKVVATGGRDVEVELTTAGMEGSNDGKKVKRTNDEIGTEGVKCEERLKGWGDVQCGRVKNKRKVMVDEKKMVV